MDSYILSAQRSPIGSFQGIFSQTPAPRIAAPVMVQALEKAQVSKGDVDQVFMGQVLTAGVGQAPARQSALFSGIPSSTPCTTVNKVCGSGMQALILAHHYLALGEAQVVVAGGQENMTLTPHLLGKSRQGYRMGHGQLVDSMIHDGLWDPYNQLHMGEVAELCVEKYDLQRELLDDWALKSYKKTLKAHEEGKFREEITSFEVKKGKEQVTVNQDEEPQRARFEKIPRLPPAFKKDGRITAANASKINDGASALVLAHPNFVSEQNLSPMACIRGYGGLAQDPKWFTTAPALAIKNLLKKTGFSLDQIDLFEINEAFSAVVLATIKELSLDPEKVNIFGGAVALGHPIGCSGARIVTTLIHALKAQKKKYGLASICLGGGEALALLVENL